MEGDELAALGYSDPMFNSFLYLYKCEPCDGGHCTQGKYYAAVFFTYFFSLFNLLSFIIFNYSYKIIALTDLKSFRDKIDCNGKCF